MKRCGFLIVVSALWAVGGCVELDVWLKEKAPTEPTPTAKASPRPRVLVNPGDVTERNAREMLQALGAELDRSESDQRPDTPATSSRSKTGSKR